MLNYKFFAIILGLLFQTLSHASDINILMPYGPGNFDSVVRTFITDIKKIDNNSNFYIENRPGAGGIVGLRAYLEKPVAANNLIGVGGSLLIGEPLMRSEHNFNDKLKIIGPVLYFPFALATKNDHNIKNLDVLFNKTVPKKTINIGVTGEIGKLVVDTIAKNSHHDIKAIVFRGSSDAYVALRSDSIDIQLDALGFFFNHKDQINVLGVTEKNNKTYPSVVDYVPESQMIQFLALAVRSDAANVEPVSNVLSLSVKTPNSVNYWRNLGYEIDHNKNNDFMFRIVLPTLKVWGGKGD